VIIAGVHAPVAATLKEVADDGDTLVHLARLRVDTDSTTPAMERVRTELLEKYGHDHARFVEAANEAVRWGEAEPSEG